MTILATLSFFIPPNFVHLRCVVERNAVRDDRVGIDLALLDGLQEGLPGDAATLFTYLCQERNTSPVAMNSPLRLSRNCRGSFFKRGER
jgi:hypothetical protein